MSLPVLLHRVLVIDDSPSDQELIRIACEMADLPVVIESIGDGIEAMRQLGQAAISDTLPAMVLLDLNMPRANGFEVLDFLCVRRLVERVPVIVLSTTRRSEDRRRCLALGARAMYSKPESIEELRRLVEELRVHLNDAGAVPP